MVAPVPCQFSESERLAALERYDVLDTPRERELDDIVAIAAQICGVQTALISLVDAKRQWFKATLGLEATETPREISFCAHTIEQTGTMIVEDARLDPRFADNPLVTGEPRLRFYAGAPLVTPDGLLLGTLCVLATEPRSLTDEQRQGLEALARQVMNQFELRRMLAAKHAGEKELRESETRGRLALDAAELGAWEAVPALNHVFGDARARELMGYHETGPMSFDDYLSHVHEADRDRFADAIQHVIAVENRGRLDIDYRILIGGGRETRWLRSRAQAVKHPGERYRLVGTVRDITADKAAEAHRQLLSNELQHRVKNTLGVVQGIVSQSLRTAETPAEARDAITSRLSTLAHAHDILTQSSWTAAPIHSVVEGAVLAHCAETARVRINGPTVDLRARSALALSMALHELFTNAVKYGSLSNDMGVVELGWTIGAGQGGESGFELFWQERGGPPVTPPTRTGFGTRLTGSSLAGDLGGSGVVDYASDGVRWRLSTTLAAIREEPTNF